MYYDESIGSFTNDFLEKIENTDFYYNVPYKIDKEKYGIVARRRGLKTTGIESANVVSFSADYGIDEDAAGKMIRRSFFVWPKNSADGSDDWHDVFFFGYCSGMDIPIDEYENVVMEILGCVTGIDIDCSAELLGRLLDKLDKTVKEIQTLREIIKQ